MKKVEQKFNELVRELFINTPVSYACVSGVASFLIGSEDKEAKQTFYKRPEIISIYSSGINNVFNNTFPIEQYIFDKKFKEKLNIGFSKMATIAVINKVAECDDIDLEKFLVSNLKNMINDNVSLLYWGDRLNDKALNIVLKSDFNKKTSSLFDKRFLTYFFKRLESSSQNFSEELRIFLEPYIKEFKKSDYAATVVSFIGSKYPESLEEYKKTLKIKTNKNELVSLSTDLISLKLNKEELYKIINLKGIIDKDRYWLSLNYVEKFLTKKSEKLGINYITVGGYSNSHDSFIFILEKNENFKLNNDNLSKMVLQLLECFINHKGNKLTKEELDSGNKVVDFFVLENTLSKKTTNKKIKV